MALQSVADRRAESSLRLVVVVPTRATEARAMVREFGGEIVDDPQRGKLAGAMNAGVAARLDEEYYCGLGDDDLLRPGGIALLHSLMKRNPRNVVAYGGCDYIDDSGKTIGVSRAGQWAHRILAWGPDLVPHPGTLIKLDALEKVGGFDEARPFTMDLDAFLKLKRVGSFVSTKTSVSAFRWHRESMTVANRKVSNREARATKRQYLPRALQPISPLWSYPVAWAISGVGRILSSR
ncbi:hypothetical protein DF220_11750 [Salinibacterium hongtaonis]|uniref:Glycosyltransferase 2-like domain-containing protein n=1 Tax=Homoserinimonas hongtaonis TaxID=2079791 RepID=A0A2U1SWT1_9MICO|nr:hypothetical protein DF220_11750 [Salinibacterium hongtaonis]